jgi:prophage regulatory protein
MGRRDEISIGRLVRQFTIPATGLVRLWEVLTVLPICKSDWWAGVKLGRYPRPVKQSEPYAAWKADDIRALIKQIAEQQPTGPHRLS